MVQWLRCCTSIVGGTSLIPGWGTKISTCYVARRWGGGNFFLTKNKSYLLHCFHCKNELLTKDSPHQNLMGERINCQDHLEGVCRQFVHLSVGLTIAHHEVDLLSLVDALQCLT